MNKDIDWKRFENWQEAFDVLESRSHDRAVIKYLKEKNVVEISGQQLYKDIHKNASVICRLGLQGKHIGLVGYNSYDLFINLCAILYTGSVAVIFNNDFTFQELNEHGKVADIEALIYDHSFEETCLKADLKVRLLDIEESDVPGVISLRKEREKEIVTIVNNTHKNDMVNILFTSGTTGKSKAVMHTNSSLLSGFFSELFYEDFSSVLAILPFHHIAGYGLALVGLCQEKTVCIGSGPQNIFRYLKKLKPDCVFLVPALLQVICQKLKKNTQEELGWNLRLLGCGGAKFPANLLKTAVNSGFVVRQIYGASESLGRGINGRVSLSNLDTLGKTDPLMETKLLEGELAIKGPTVCQGYYKNPEESASTFIDGWYYTGDMARIDENGLYYLTGRKKNLIILSNGENVSPEAIEQVLVNYEEIQEILVREENDYIGAVIYPLYPEKASDEEKIICKKKIDSIIENYNSSVPTYKQIQFISYTEDPLPKTASGKIIRY